MRYVERFFDALADDFNTAMAARRAVRVGRPRATAAWTPASGSARQARRDALRARPGEPARGRGRAADPEARAAAARARGGARGQATSPPRTPGGTSWPPSAGRCATPPRARASCDAGDRLRPQPGAGGAARAPARCRRVWATGARRAGGVARGRGGAAWHRDEEIESLCGSPDHQGMCADAAPYAYADEGSLLAAEDALVVCLDQIQDPRNLGAICRVAECAGAAGVVIPERRSAEVTAVVVQGVGGRRRAPAGGARAQHRGLAGGGEAGGRLGLRRLGRRHPLRASRTTRGRVVLVLGSEGRGLRPRVADACDELVALPIRGQDRVAQRLGGRRGACLWRLAISRPRGLTRLHNVAILPAIR